MIRTPYYVFYAWIAILLICCFSLPNHAVAQRLRIESNGRAFERAAVKEATVELTVEGRTIVLDDLFFDSRDADLNPAGRQTLHRLVEFLAENPGMIVVSSSEMRWSGRYEDRLSYLRTESVRRFLMDQGISVHRIIVLVDAPPGRGKGAGLIRAGNTR